MQKEVSIDYSEGEGINKEEYKGTVVMKRLNFSEMNQYEEEAGTLNYSGGVPQYRVSTSKAKELGILKTLVSSEIKKTTYSYDKDKKLKSNEVEYKLDLVGIKNLPLEIGRQLVQEFEELNTMNENKKKN